MTKIFLICPVRNATDEQKTRMMEYISNLEKQGHRVHYPARDTKQEDETGGWNICTDNKNAILASDEVHIFWDDKSTGSLFDLGVAFCANKKLIVVNPESINLSNTKSFHNFINYWNSNPPIKKTPRLSWIGKSSLINTLKYWICRIVGHKYVERNECFDINYYVCTRCGDYW